MNASWQSVVAGIAKGLIALSVLPVRQRWLPVSLIALLPALLVVVTWVIPQGYQSLDIRQRIVLLEHKIGEPGRLHAARPSGFKEVWQHVVAKFPHWQPQHAEHRWLGGLVELGAEARGQRRRAEPRPERDREGAPGLGHVEPTELLAQRQRRARPRVAARAREQQEAGQPARSHGDGIGSFGIVSVVTSDGAARTGPPSALSTLQIPTVWLTYP